MKLTKIVIALAGGAAAGLLAAVSISPPAMTVRQAMFAAAANHATLYVMGITIIGFFYTLYLTNKIGE